MQEVDFGSTCLLLRILTIQLSALANKIIQFRDIVDVIILSVV